MTSRERWLSAQCAEKEFWDGISLEEEGISKILAANYEVARRIESWLDAIPNAALEIGIGAFGIGALGFLAKFPLRIGLDPLPPLTPSCGEALRQRIDSLRRDVHLLIAQGERTPFADNSFELVLCSNVLDHVRNPKGVLAEARRVLRPGGHLYLEVDVFSLAGLGKWYLWTRHRHKDEILVRAHPQRFWAGNVIRCAENAGFEAVRTNGQSLWAEFLGDSGRAMMLVRKPAH